MRTVSPSTHFLKKNKRELKDRQSFTCLGRRRHSLPSEFPFFEKNKENPQSSVVVAQCFSAPSRHMVLTRFPTLTGLVSPAPVLHPCFSLASSASCDAFTEQQTSFMEPGPCSTQARSSLGKRKVQRL